VKNVLWLASPDPISEPSLLTAGVGREPCIPGHTHMGQSLDLAELVGMVQMEGVG
jgi:hypothetical protein